ncbi:PfkB family carbohydrate kinase [Bdellovibrio reynosensis]|uniref:PfkB family carbohydrate kinase n=1 Tax=Bdellovibrio reynosensis TaxID=2835041 RepID=A0ABY4C5L5_9BACT|nr:PfkB family carbohydrate kinase [Bdellovibrio reynosensis]UOE99773.1 PfkB family carbohydrate kinase [Bdellovibrio reynosensis]
MSEILVVGSLAYDSIQTPSGKVDRALGGSANYFSLAASLFSKVRVVGVVGEDYDQEHYELLNKRGVDLGGLSKVPGKTFHWAGSYEGDLNEAKTLKTELNVFEHFNPQLPEHFKDSSFVFLANIAPELQLQVLEQVKQPKFVGMDTMNFWISIKKDKLVEVLKKVDLVLINEGEAKMLTGAANAISAAPLLTALGPKAVVIKRGEYGFAMYTKDEGYFILPAMPIPTVVDPTGAGDTFAGGFFGYLAAQKEVPTIANLKQACIMGSMMASHTIQDFSVNALSKVTLGDLEKRLSEYRKVITV